MRSWLTREIGGAPYWLLICVPLILGLYAAVIVPAELRPQPSDRQATSVSTAFPFISPSATPSTIPVPANPRLLVLGDSYTQGFAASPLKKGYAYLVGSALGWKTDVEGVGGTGFTYSPTGRLDFGQRIATYIKTSTFDPNVIVLEGSQNDYRSVSTITAAVVADVKTLKKAYPKAAIVLFGPAAPQPLQSQLSAIDAADQAAATQLDIPYISPYQEGWITAANTKLYGYSDGAHLNTAGHAYLAKRFLADFRPLFGL